MRKCEEKKKKKKRARRAWRLCFCPDQVITQLIHRISKVPKVHNMTTVDQQLKPNEIKAKDQTYGVLGLQIDTRGPLVRKIYRTKMVKQSYGIYRKYPLRRFDLGGGGATFSKARQVYTAVLRPAMTYGLTGIAYPKWRPKKSRWCDKRNSQSCRTNALRTVGRGFFQSHHPTVPCSRSRKTFHCSNNMFPPSPASGQKPRYRAPCQVKRHDDSNVKRYV